MLNKHKLAALAGPVERLRHHFQPSPQRNETSPPTGLGHLNKERLDECRRQLCKLGGENFSEEYLPFLMLLNGFNHNGLTLFGLKDDQTDLTDLQGAKQSLQKVASLYPSEFEDWVWIGETSQNTLIYNKETGAFELRDRIALDSYEEPTDLSGLLARMANLLDLWQASAESEV